MQPYPYYYPQMSPVYQEMQSFQMQPVYYRHIRSDPSSSFVPKRVLDNVRRQYRENLIQMESGYSNEIYRRDEEIRRLNASLRDLENRVQVLEQTVGKHIDNSQKICSKQAVKKKGVPIGAEAPLRASNAAGRVSGIWSYFIKRKIARSNE